MYMKDWLETIDDYLKMTRRDILTSSGHISHKQAIEKAHAEYDKYKNRLDDKLSPVEKDFIESIGMLEEIVDNTLWRNAVDSYRLDGILTSYSRSRLC